MQAAERSFAKTLRAVAGDAAVLTDPARAGNVGALLASGAVTALVVPESVDRMAAVLAHCTSEGWPVTPLGAGTWMGAAASATRPPVLVSTRALTRTLEHEPADLVAGVQAGVPLLRLQQHLTQHRQMLPLDPPAADEATVGAIIALGSAGPLRAGHGTPRDMVLGLEIVTGDGRVLRFGGRVVKNVAGYDLVRLLTGSRGAFGIITTAWLRLRGAPRADRTLAVTLPGAAAAAPIALAAREAVAWSALEVLSPAASGAAGGPAQWTMIARVQGNAHGVAEAVARLRQIAPGSRLFTEVEAADMWERLRRSEGAAASTVALDVGVADLEHALRQDTMHAERDGWRIAAHATDGIVRLWHPDAREIDIETPTGRAASRNGLPTRLHAGDPRRTVIQGLLDVFDRRAVLTPRNDLL